MPKVHTSTHATTHAEARAAYLASQARNAELKPHREYADRVAKATEGDMKTPVRPLATFGTGGGPLICDHCGQPFKLQLGGYNNVVASDAWRRNGGKDFTAWILGGIVIEVTYNGTLRVYHGHTQGTAGECATIGHQQIIDAESSYQPVRPPRIADKLVAFFAEEFPGLSDRDRDSLLTSVMSTLYQYDPGIGVNRPD